MQYPERVKPVKAIPSEEQGWRDSPYMFLYLEDEPSLFELLPYSSALIETRKSAVNNRIEMIEVGNLRAIIGVCAFLCSVEDSSGVVFLRWNTPMLPTLVGLHVLVRMIGKRKKMNREFDF